MSDINKCLAACQEYRNKLDKLEAENAELRNELARVNNQTNWECTCGGTDCAGLKENAALREDKERLDFLDAIQWHGGAVTSPMMDGTRFRIQVGTRPISGNTIRAAIDSVRKEAQP